MPYTTHYIDPDLFLVHHGIRVYHTYDDDDYDQGATRYEFTTSLSNRWENNAVFHVLELKVPSAEKLIAGRPAFITLGRGKESELARQWDKWHEEIEPALIKAAICEAIDAGLIVRDDE